ncbi:hypothetical protein BUALT_Bualt01G0228200 [Buddleja alternifolia]|uniref:C3H1-type domain-containing protein n=1 Tax=Buddleja alternifolia TaxID=168488 RepID=A0AAV6YG82_9LAMI|nr:hypothetical protein BUALT_Bualt01G0228200 [Buddleja alternifolia]
MDYRRENGFSNDNVVQVLSGNSGYGVNENWGPTDQAVWATEDEYGMWNREASIDNNSNSNYDVRLSQSQSGNEPPNKRSRNSHSGDLMSSNRSKAIGKMFYKTKLCCKFRAGTCPYITNCNFAHSIEELRKPPPNWQEIVAQNEDERGVSESREEYQIPILGVSDDAQRSFKGRHCKKFYTEEGCPYGESCTFLHDEQSKARESVAISLGPGSGAGGGYGSNGSGLSTLKPSNWKTRICNKWELTGYCPFGSKCHFAHGAAELHRFGGTMDSEDKDHSTPDAKQGIQPAKTSADTFVASLTSVPHSDNYHIGVPSQRMSNVLQKPGQRSTQKWKGPDKISKIYGDWIDDLE